MLAINDLPRDSMGEACEVLSWIVEFWSVAFAGHVYK